MRALILICMVFSAPAVWASDGAVCDVAARQAEQKYELPSGLLQAIARVETNSANAGEMKAWPWTVNAGGEGRWFESRREAEAFVAVSRSRGTESIDIGCFQINAKWHGDAFDDDAAMFDPDKSADYAASFLHALKIEQGDWRSAIKSYHSRTPGLAERYAEKVIESFEEAGGDAEFSIFRRRIGAGGVGLSLFQAGAPLLMTSAPLVNAAGRSAIIDRTARTPLDPGERGRAN